MLFSFLLSLEGLQAGTGMDTKQPSSELLVGWSNVLGSSLFVAFAGQWSTKNKSFHGFVATNWKKKLCPFPAYISRSLELRLEIPLIVSALRCVCQLTLMVNIASLSLVKESNTYPIKSSRAWCWTMFCMCTIQKPLPSWQVNDRLPTGQKMTACIEQYLVGILIFLGTYEIVYHRSQRTFRGLVWSPWSLSCDQLMSDKHQLMYGFIVVPDYVCHTVDQHRTRFMHGSGVLLAINAFLDTNCFHPCVGHAAW